MIAVIEKLNRVLSELDELANHFEGAGFEAQSDMLDGAAQKLEDVRNGLEALTSFGASQRRNRRKEAAHA